MPVKVEDLEHRERACATHGKAKAMTSEPEKPISPAVAKLRAEVAKLAAQSPDEREEQMAEIFERLSSTPAGNLGKTAHIATLEAQMERWQRGEALSLSVTDADAIFEAARSGKTEAYDAAQRAAVMEEMREQTALLGEIANKLDLIVAALGASVVKPAESGDTLGQRVFEAVRKTLDGSTKG